MGRVEARLTSLSQASQFTDVAREADAPVVEDVPADAAFGPVQAALGNLESAVTTLAERLRVGELAGFTLDS